MVVRAAAGRADDEAIAVTRDIHWCGFEDKESELHCDPYLPRLPTGQPLGSTDDVGGREGRHEEHQKGGEDRAHGGHSIAINAPSEARCPCPLVRSSTRPRARPSAGARSAHRIARERRGTRVATLRGMRAKLLSSMAAAVFVLVSLPGHASACGGFFCNRQGIQQTGERVLFSYEPDGSVTTVVQIAYAGPSEEFAWILPVPALPEISLGTDALFAGLERETAPSFGLDFDVVGHCRRAPCCGCLRTNVLTEGGGGPPLPSRERGSGVAVRSRADVGPYDAAVLSADDADALRRWLEDNGYFVPAAAAAALDPYVAAGSHFVALRLRKERSAGEIQPIVLRSSNREPCIPIRLTAIATVADLPVTVYFLADRRVRPFDYLLVSADLDSVAMWLGRETYAQMVTRVVDDVGGHAFVTDFAGAPPLLEIELPSIDDLETELDPVAFLIALRERGFGGDSQLLAILERHLLPPEGVAGRQYFNCLANDWCDLYDDHLAGSTFDPLALVEALREAIMEPRREAYEMLEGHAHLTRLFTTLSADEMDLDPTFIPSDELPSYVSNRHEATLRYDCGPAYFRWSAPQTLITEGGEQVVFEGVEYGGTNDDYCEDEGFRPGRPIEELREIAARRAPADVLGGGGLRCGAAPRGAGLPWALVFFPVLLVVRRARR